MAMQGARLSQKQVLEWFDKWDYTDRVQITAALDAIPDAVRIVPPYGGNIGAWTDARRALIIWPGWLTWPAGRWARDLPPDLFPEMQRDQQCSWHLLSTFRGHDASVSSKERPVEVCPIHFLVLPATGVCDDCG